MVLSLALRTQTITKALRGSMFSPSTIETKFFLESLSLLSSIKLICLAVTGFRPKFLIINGVMVLIIFIICLICIFIFETLKPQGLEVLSDFW